MRLIPSLTIIAIIVREGIKRMYEDQENIFYYITVYNENYVMPAMPDNAVTKEGILKGTYCFSPYTSNIERPSLKILANIFKDGLSILLVYGLKQ